MGREGETLRQAASPQPGTTPCLACGKSWSFRGGEANRDPHPAHHIRQQARAGAALPGPSGLGGGTISESRAQPPPAGLRTRGDASALGLGGGVTPGAALPPSPGPGARTEGAGRNGPLRGGIWEWPASSPASLLTSYAILSPYLSAGPSRIRSAF